MIGRFFGGRATAAADVLPDSAVERRAEVERRRAMIREVGSREAEEARAQVAAAHERERRAGAALDDALAAHETAVGDDLAQQAWGEGSALPAALAAYLAEPTRAGAGTVQDALRALDEQSQRKLGVPLPGDVLGKAWLAMLAAERTDLVTRAADLLSFADSNGLLSVCATAQRAALDASSGPAVADARLRECEIVAERTAAVRAGDPDARALAIWQARMSTVRVADAQLREAAAIECWRAAKRGEEAANPLPEPKVKRVVIGGGDESENAGLTLVGDFPSEGDNAETAGMRLIT